MGTLGWLAIIGGIAVFGATGLKYMQTTQHEENVRLYGIETEAVVLRNYSKAIEGNKEAKHKMIAYTYVNYVDTDGNTHEATLNISTNFLPGDKVKIKYLPANYEYAMLVPVTTEMEAEEN